MAETKPNETSSNLTKSSLPQKPLLMPLSNTGSMTNQNETTPRLSSSFLPIEINTPDSRRKSTGSPSKVKHYSDNLYSLLNEGINNRKRLSRSTFGGVNPLLESLSGMQKMLITKNIVLTSKTKRTQREVRFSLQNADENLDEGDPFQSTSFSLDIENPHFIEFKVEDDDGLDLDEEQPYHYCGKFAETLEHAFDDKVFNVLLTEHGKSKSIGNVQKVHNDYHVFDHNEKYLFQIEKVPHVKGKAQIAVLKRNEAGEVEVEMGTVAIGDWRAMALESEIAYGGFCSAKEKLLILSAVLVMLMKMSPGEGILGHEHLNGACSVGGVWKEVIDRIRSLF